MPPKYIESFLILWPQWATGWTVTLLSISFGLAVGWTSPYLARLTSKDSWLTVTENQAAWVASLLPLGRFFGAIAGAVLLEYFGSKRSLLCSGVPVIIGWICIICANSADWLYIYRFCSGVSIGMYFSCFSLFIGEIAEPSIRGALVSLIVNGFAIGMLLGNAMGTLISMKCFGFISLFLNLCYIAIFPLLPQSPYYHVRMNNLEKAKQSIQWYLRQSNVEVELDIIERFVQSTRTMSFRKRLERMTEKKHNRMFIVIMLLFIFMQLSGLNTVTYYMEIILKKSKITCMKPGTVVILSSGLAILIGWISVYLIDRCGRRVLMAASCICVISAMMLLGLHFVLLDQNYHPKNLEWIPILAMMLFIMMSIGLIPVPNTMLGEVFPDELKSLAGFTASLTSALFAFICSRTYQPMIDLMSEKYVFFTYAAVMTCCLVISILCIPETKGKTLQEIQDMLTEENMSREATHN
ncbi:facilitated trehalose transporter Tret1 [Calliopsis andreniformis]|uniref:facilitated trehalose transporter Tret1 n=1 Tax=Calliopsis andreniformis TaxID=337506 RepID=UPI003FCD7229